MALPPGFMTDTVVVETQTGEGGLGDQYAAPVRVVGSLSYSRQKVLNAAGAEVVSEATFYTDLDARALFVPDSRVTLDDGSQTYVLSIQPQTGGPAPWLAHLQVTLR